MMTEYCPVVGAEVTVQVPPRERIKRTELIPGAEAIAEDLFRVFLLTHQTTKKFTAPLTLEAMKDRNDLAEYAGYQFPLCEIAGYIREVANHSFLTDEHIAEGARELTYQAGKRAGVDMYKVWLREHEREIESDFGAIVEKRPELSIVENGEESSQIAEAQRAA